MKRSLYLLPLMAATALSLSLAACDDNKDNQVPADQATIEQPATTETPAPEAATEAAPAQTMMAASSATAYATAEGATTGAVFLTIQNTGTADAKLVGASSDASSSVEIHETYTDPATGTTEMRTVVPVDIAAGQTLEMRPDGYHLMLLGLNKTLVEGETLSLTLRFQNAPDVVIPVTITAPGGTDSSAATTTHDHDAMTAPTTEAPAATEEVTPTPSVDETSAMPSSNDATSGSVTADAPATDAPAADETVE
ncbi:MAG: hypothetical protein DI626_04675 [Micavibrio aeruginosavorus]|uniref:Copper chaperone PCu(A)C n=1 Tax=Micavibrio aeruginosavorus TaxID=349221 RepID=A0A2W4ZXU3_9BACT|nr:MAG: hypothetical protein DI626_04675 [Micavibrio aeruginosavorus]